MWLSLGIYENKVHPINYMLVLSKNQVDVYQVQIIVFLKWLK